MDYFSSGFIYAAVGCAALAYAATAVEIVKHVFGNNVNLSRFEKETRNADEGRIVRILGEIGEGEGQR